MILRPKSSPRLQAPTLEAAAAAPGATLPTWLRRAVPAAQSLTAHSLEDVALAAGAAIGALDAVVRQQERWSGAWRQRLALAAAAATARQVDRIEEEATLRDAVLLTKAGDDVGPAGRMLLGWRRLVTRPSEELLTIKSLGAVLEEFGQAPDEDALGDLAGDLRRPATGGMVGMVVGGFAAAERYGLGPAVGAWFADALLAQRLGWAQAMPLLGTEGIAGLGAGRPRRSATAPSIDDEGTWAKSLLTGQARAALRAIDLAAELERRADRLLAVAPKLRAKAANVVVEQLLNQDALVASRGNRTTGMSDRAMRRLFDRLVELGAVRELSGRPTFRIYGL